MTAASSYPYVEEYLDTLLRHGRKPVTILRYRQVLGMMLRELDRLGRPTDPHGITEDDIYDLFASLRVAESSKESYLYILKQWCRFYVNPQAEHVRLLLNRTRAHCRWVSEDDIKMSLSISPHPQDRLILHLGSAYGLRRGEIAALKIGDLGPDMMTRAVARKWSR